MSAGIAQWDAQQVRDWMLPAFEWLDQQWEANPELRWEDLSSGFLQQLGLGHESEFFVVQQLFEWTATLSDQDCRAALTTQDQRDEALAFFVQRWEVEAAMARTASLEWVTPEQQEQLNILWESFGDWRQWLPAQLDDAWPEWRGSTAEVLVPWLNPYIVSWVSSVTVTPDPTPTEPPVADATPTTADATPATADATPATADAAAPAVDATPAADAAAPAVESPAAGEQAATPEKALIEAIVEADLADSDAPDLTEEEIRAAINQILADRGEAPVTTSA